MRSVVCLSIALLILPGCGLFDAFTGAREPAPGPAPEARGAGAPPLVAAPGGVSKGEAHELFIRPTAATRDGVVRGQKYRLEVTDAHPSGGTRR
jgi:hypothetical protein